jgi:hypothetical protein
VNSPGHREKLFQVAFFVRQYRGSLKEKRLDSFSTYFELGWLHIFDFSAIDHILFLLVMICVYQVIDLKRVVLIVTAFTIGHSLTLILATLNVIRVDSDWVEFLIPLTILVTAIGHIWRGRKSSTMFWSYFLAAFFGLIHGLGFSNYLRALLGKQDSIVAPLLAFNLGIEVGQIAIFLAVMLVSMLVFQVFRLKHRDWILVVAGGCAGAAILLLKDAIFW